VCCFLLSRVSPEVHFFSARQRVLNVLEKTRAFSLKYHLTLSHPLPPSLPSVSSTGDTQKDWERETTCWLDRGLGGVGARSYILRRENLVLYKWFNTLWCQEMQGGRGYQQLSSLGKRLEERVEKKKYLTRKYYETNRSITYRRILGNQVHFRTIVHYFLFFVYFYINFVICSIHTGAYRVDKNT